MVGHSCQFSIQFFKLFPVGTDPIQYMNGNTWLLLSKLATIVEGDQKAPFLIATTPRGREGRYSFPWIAPLYIWYIPYIAEC